jgi:hypothetical protein
MRIGSFLESTSGKIASFFKRLIDCIPTNPYLYYMEYLGMVSRVSPLFSEPVDSPNDSGSSPAHLITGGIYER